MRRIAIVLCCLAASVAGAGAQERPFVISVVGGTTGPLGDARDAMGTGWNVGVGGTVFLTHELGIRADYLYSRFGAAEATWQVTFGPWLPALTDVTVSAKTQMHTGSLDLVWSPRSRGARVYVMAGPSAFRRRVQISGTGPQGDTGACSVQWLQCAPAAVGFDRALGIKKSIDLGFNVGGGVSFDVGLSARLTVEARYFFVEGPPFTSTKGRTTRANASFVPLSIGLSF